MSSYFSKVKTVLIFVIASKGKTACKYSGGGDIEISSRTKVSVFKKKLNQEHNYLSLKDSFFTVINVCITI